MALRDKRATASYNFVPLPATVIKSPIDGGAESDAERQANYKEYVKKHGKLSGYIELHCRTMTPVFIGMGDKEGAFFAPAGKPILPGSTLRGMVKNIFKIVTCGAMRWDKDSADIADSALYYRSFMNNSYKAELVGNKKIAPGKYQSFTKAEAGFLIHDKLANQHYICPAQFHRVKDPGLVAKYEKTILWDEYKERGGELACFTGPMTGGRTAKTHYTVHCAPDWTPSSRIPVSEEIIARYKEDLTRDEDLDLFKLAKRDEAAARFVGDDACDFVVPCFYKEKAGEVVHFGFGQYYRIPYPHTIGEHLPDVMKGDAAVVDYADAIFGRKELWGSRLAFEDAVLKEDKGFDVGEARFSKTLGEPKPTSFQLYMEQEDGKNLNHWGTENAAIRGYKLYWHQKPGFRWQKDGVVNENVDRKLRPLKAGNAFEGRIRFKNLSEVELGALLKVFSLSAEDRELCFKIGQGKGIGLGSIRIDAKLVLVDEVHGYEELFAADGDWNKSERETSMDEYLKAFDDIIAELGKTERARYDLSQQALLDLLDWKAVEQKDWAARTRQMTLGSDKNPDEAFDKEVKQFRNRWVLPTAHEVYSEGKGK